MPVSVEGLSELQRNLRRFDPALKKDMDRSIKQAMLPIRDAARGFVRDPAPRGLSNWAKPAVGVHYRPFPQYDAGEIRRGIIYSAGKNKKNQNGWAAHYYIANKSAAGAIYETAGRKNPNGQPHTAGGRGNHANSNSNNPDAGAHMISRSGPLYGKDKQRGRLIYKAWEQDQGRVYGAILKAIESAAADFNANRTGVMI